MHTLTFNPQSLLTVLPLSFSFAHERFFFNNGLNSLKVPFCRSRTIKYAQGFKPSTSCGQQMCFTNPVRSQKLLFSPHVRGKNPQTGSSLLYAGRAHWNHSLKDFPKYVSWGSTSAYLILLGFHWNILEPFGTYMSTRIFENALLWEQEASGCGLFPCLHPEVLEGITGERGTDATFSGLRCSFCTFLGQEPQSIVLRTAFFSVFWFETTAVMHY